MKINFINQNNNIFAFFLYFTLIFGFLIGENLNYGSYNDWIYACVPPIKDFSLNFFDTLLNYDQYGHRHSPVYLIFLSVFLDFGLTFEQIRFLHLHLSIPLIVIFYHCLKLQFNKVDSKYLQLLSLTIFLSPTFRSLSIWPDSRLPGLLFFVLSIYFFLKFKKNASIKYVWFNCISLIISSYISPNFSVFFIYFLIFFIKKINIKNLIKLLFFNFLAAMPMLYYILILKVNFLVSGKTPGLNGESIAINFNFADKIMIISSIILFHLLPILMNNSFYYKKFLNFIKKNIFKILLLLIILMYFFNYQISYTGGGFFFQLSNLFFNNNYLFFLLSFFSISLVIYLSFLNSKNFLLLLLLFLSNIQNSIYHKYYEPMIVIMFFTLLQNVNAENFFKKKINLIYLYIFSLVFILLRLFKNNYLL